MSVGERAEQFNGDDVELSWTVCVCRHTAERKDGRLRNLCFIEGKVIHVVWNICELKRTKEAGVDEFLFYFCRRHLFFAAVVMKDFVELV